MTDTVWTIGHSNRTFDEFARTLEDSRIELIADVRRFPGSRRLPQFASETLRATLESRGIAYGWIPALGGRRRPDPDSPSTGWTHPAFSAYADHIGTEEFAEGLTELSMLAGGLRTAIMCAEALWWRCHRRLVSDAVVARGGNVLHIGADGRLAEHRLPDFAVVRDGHLTYPPAQTALDL